LSFVAHHHGHGAAVDHGDLVQSLLLVEGEALREARPTFFCIFMMGCISSTAIFLVLGSSRMVRVADCMI
jgi:hypothetical protein